MRGEDHEEVAVSALKKADDHFDNTEPNDVACALADFDFHDDVTPEGVQLLRDKAADILNNRNWKVVGGYVGRKLESPCVDKNAAEHL